MAGSTFRFDGREVWYTIVGELGGRAPLVCVPGGPGASHIYLRPLAGLAAMGRPVVFYDALASGKSEYTDRRDWTQEVYVDELAALLETLALPRYHLFAHSAAGLAAYPFAVARPAGLCGLVLASCPASIPVYHESMRQRLGFSRAELERFELAERGLAPRDLTYMRQATRFLGLLHRPSAPGALRGAEGTTNVNAHRAIKGGSCFYTTLLATWDITARLGEIAARTLITCGRHDTVSTEVFAGIQGRIPRAELAVFEESAHLAHLEETPLYLERVARFLDACDVAADQTRGA